MTNNTTDGANLKLPEQCTFLLLFEYIGVSVDLINEKIFYMVM